MHRTECHTIGNRRARGFWNIAVWVVLCAAGLHAAAKDEAATAKKSPQEHSVQPISSDHLPNLVQVVPRVLSGGEPHGESAFAELKQRGVKTIVSVDGALPNVELAQRFGLRYVHLPHGYDGITASHARLLAKAIVELKGPFYFHCHHGRHRSPAAAAVACRTAGWISAEQADEVLQIASTSPRYVGLFDAVHDATPVSVEELQAIDAAFPETAEVAEMLEVMVQLDRRMDTLRALARNHWEPLSSSPDISPRHEALLLQEQFAELLRNQLPSDREPASNPYRQFLMQSLEAAEALRGDLSNGREQSLLQATKRLKTLQETCTQCHSQYRDCPQ